MKRITYCTTCKGRLWQLKRTLPTNIKLTNNNIDIVLLDYHSQDGLEDYIKSRYGEHLEDGRLKYYKLSTPLDGFDMAYAKHIAHTLATGEVLFNLDADNYIGITPQELQELKPQEVLIARKLEGTGTSRGGRIGIHRNDYLTIGGYEIRQLGMFGDDGLFLQRALGKQMKLKWSTDSTIPIQQTELYKQVNVVDRHRDFTLPATIQVVDSNNNVIDVTLSLKRNTL